MVQIFFNNSLDTFLHDAAEGYLKGCYSTAEYLDIMNRLANDFTANAKTNCYGK